MKYRNSVTEVGNKKLVSNWIVTVEAMISLVESVTESSNMKESINEENHLHVGDHGIFALVS